MITVQPALLSDADELAAVAAVTFPLACPPHATAADIAEFIATVLSAECFSAYLTDESRHVLKAVEGDSIVGYAMLVSGEPADPTVGAAASMRPTMEVSKVYVLPGRHGSGVAAALLEASIVMARESGCAAMWLGVNQENARAQRFYAKHGFERVGVKTFAVGTQTHHDYVLQVVL